MAYDSSEIFFHQKLYFKTIIKKFHFHPTQFFLSSSHIFFYYYYHFLSGFLLLLLRIRQERLTPKSLRISTSFNISSFHFQNHKIFFFPRKNLSVKISLNFTGKILHWSFFRMRCWWFKVKVNTVIVEQCDRFNIYMSGKWDCERLYYFFLQNLIFTSLSFFSLVFFGVSLVEIPFTLSTDGKL